MNTKQLVKEQLQEDILTILEGFGVDEAMEGGDYNNLVSALCHAAITNINKIEANSPSKK